MTAEIITIGDEILYGQIIDTNSSWIGAALSDIGIKVLRRASVGDEKSEILDILKQASQRVQIVLVTGGLGPTKDDITKHTFCEFFGTTLIENQEALALVSSFFEIRGRQLTDINRQQAWLPSNCEYIPNQYGTAPAMWFNHNGTVFVSMPGVPNEMKGIMTDQIIPRLQKRFETPVIHHKIVKTIGIGESFLAERISQWEDKLPKHIKLAYLPSYGEVKLRLTCHGASLKALEQEANSQVALLQKLIPQYIYGYDNDELVSVIAQLLQKNNLTIATAESCTGGYLSHLITSQPGSSQYFIGGIIAYANNIKTEQLGVAEEIIKSSGAVSEATAAAMAAQVRIKYKASIGIATTGIAGPGGATTTKPVGLVYIALSSKDHNKTIKLSLGGSRSQNIQLSAIILLNLLRKYLLGIDE
jgi:nicotinamide-nucleotide amidase